MNQKHILPCPKFLVFSTSSLPQSFSILPTSLLLTSPLLPTYLISFCIHSIVRAQESLKQEPGQSQSKSQVRPKQELEGKLLLFSSFFFVIFFFGFVTVKKAMTASCYRLLFFYFVAKKKKKTTTFVINFFDGFAAKNDNNNYRRLFWWFCCKEGDDSNRTAFFLFFLFLLLWSFWYSSLELTIDNEMVVFFMLRIVMARGRKLKKSGGDLEAHKQNVASS
jgi:uncharacterized membrane protein YgcG